MFNFGSRIGSHRSGFLAWSRKPGLYFVLLVWAAWLPVHGANYYWDTNGASAGSGAATGTWDSGSSALFTLDSAGVAAPFAATTTSADALNFSAGSNGTTGTVTVSGAQFADLLTLNQSGLTFSGGTIDLSAGATGRLAVNANATINSAFNAKALNFTTARTLNFGGGSSSFLSGGGTISGATNVIGSTSTVQVNAGAYTNTGGFNVNIGNSSSNGLLLKTGSTLTSDGNLVVANSSTASGFVTVDGGTANVASGSIVVGQSGGTATVLVQNGGTLTAGNILIGSGNLAVGGNASAVATFEISDPNRGSTIKAGEISVGAGSTQGSSALHIYGGVTTVSGINMGGVTGVPSMTATGGSGSVGVDFATLYVGNGGIKNSGKGSYSSTVAFGPSGVVGVSSEVGAGAMVISANVSVSNTPNNFYFKLADENNVARNITVSGVISGGSFLGTLGGGTLRLTAVNTFRGRIGLGGGTLDLADNAGLTLVTDFGAKSFVVGGTGTANFDGDFYIDLPAGELGTWTLVDTANISTTYGSTFTVAGWTDLGGGIWTTNDRNHNYTFTESTGMLVGVVPEPSSWAMLGIGAVGIAGLSRRRSKRRGHQQRESSCG